MAQNHGRENLSAWFSLGKTPRATTDAAGCCACPQSMLLTCVRVVNTHHVEPIVVRHTFFHIFRNIHLVVDRLVVQVSSFPNERITNDTTQTQVLSPPPRRQRTSMCRRNLGDGGGKNTPAPRTRHAQAPKTCDTRPNTRHKLFYATNYSSVYSTAATTYVRTYAHNVYDTRRAVDGFYISDLSYIQPSSCSGTSSGTSIRDTPEPDSTGPFTKRNKQLHNYRRGNLKSMITKNVGVCINDLHDQERSTNAPEIIDKAFFVFRPGPRTYTKFVHVKKTQAFPVLPWKAARY